MFETKTTTMPMAPSEYDYWLRKFAGHALAGIISSQRFYDETLPYDVAASDAKVCAEALCKELGIKKPKG